MLKGCSYKWIIYVGLFNGFIPFLTSDLYSQHRIAGKVIVADDSQPVEAAHVFINQSTLGTLTADDGSFDLGPLPAGNYELIVSHIGYHSYIQMVEVGNTNVNLEIFLLPNVINLGAVTILAQRDKKRSKHLKKFTTAFLGITENGKKSRIVNPDVLSFELEPDQSLTASASDLVEVVNKNSGYSIYFLLEGFTLKGETVAYSGKPLFKELPAKDPAEKEKWKAKRTKTYQGSLRHFFDALANDRLKDEGFHVSHAYQRGNEIMEIKPADREEIYKYDEADEQPYIRIPAFLKIVYNGESDELTQTNEQREQFYDRLGRSEERSKGLHNTSNADKFQISYLYGRQDKIPMNPHNVPEQPELLLEYGYWGYERVADLLPFEYALASNEQSITKKSPDKASKKLGGFVLSQLQIPFEDIQRGGPPKDGIPSIDHPKFSSAKNVQWLGESDLVLGMEYNGIAKAYPLKILDHHEVVNDRFDSEAVVVSYCPLCNSGMAFSSQIGGLERTFGVSGLLYNSDVLLYDRQTESLWSQIQMQAISGPLAGKHLSLLTSQLTSWQTWREHHPSTLVLNKNTGFDRDYEKPSYEVYRHSESLMFPVKNKSAQIPNKEMVLGIEINGRFKAYPYKRLSKNRDGLTDIFNGYALEISYDRIHNTAAVINPSDQVRVANMYWFAWFTFHPETEVFK